MIKASSFERVLHQWEPWLSAVADARLQSYPDSDTWWSYAKAVMRKLRFPTKPLLCLYFLSCVFSQYAALHGVYCFENIQLPSILFDKFDSFNRRIAEAIWRFIYVFNFLRISPIKLCPDLMDMRERHLPPAVWSEPDVKLALEWERHRGNKPYEQLRNYYSPFFVVLAPDHPVLDMASKINRKVNLTLAIRCAQMKDLEGHTYKQIGEKFGWPIQKNEYDKPSRCSRARYYVRRGRKLRNAREH